MVKASITAITSEETGYPKENMMDWNPDTHWRPSSTSNQTIDIDLGSAQQVDQFAVWIHNYNTDYDFGTHGIQLYSDDNDDGNYTAITAMISELWDPTVGTPIYFPAASPTPTTKRYWRLAIVNCGSNIAQISGIFLLRKRTLTAAANLPLRDTGQFFNRTMRAAGGRRFVAGLNSGEGGTLPRTFVLSQTDWEALEDAHQDCRGSLRPFIYTEDSVNYYVRFTEDLDKLDQNMIHYQLYQPTITLEKIPYIQDGETT
jgi:hypothetical protein